MRHLLFMGLSTVQVQRDRLPHGARLWYDDCDKLLNVSALWRVMLPVIQAEPISAAVGRHSLSRCARLAIVMGTAIPLILLTILTPPITQPQAYHHFADRREFFGIPNTLDVLSNLPFLVVGLLALRFVRQTWHDPDVFATPSEGRIYTALFLDVALTGLGSAYYHLLLIPLISALFPAHHTGGKMLWPIVGMYPLAKLLEVLDTPVFHVTDELVSGHTLKHIAAAYATYLIWVMLRTRRPTPGTA